MLELLWLIPGLPLGGALLLLLAGALPMRLVAAVGVGSVGAAALIAGLVGIDWIGRAAGSSGHRQVLWTWMDVEGFTPVVALHLDSISLLMVWVVTGVGFFIHLYSSDYMRSENPPDYQRFFAYMNLFVAAMLLLVLADDLLVLFVGWEGVGLCSYLLIGFWYQNAANGAAARKAFVVNRIGDTAFLIGLLLLFVHLGTLNIQDLMVRASAHWRTGDALAIAAAALLLGGAVGKSAQIPLQIWLPDAMAGPTPVSALLHAATMVTAGMYAIARTHVLFDLAPPVQTAVAAIGAATLLLSALSALAQRDIKRVLAFSTISQIGYMFLALGVGATSAALFHFMTHAFFKALLFLSAGVVVLSLHHEQDLFKMGGLRRDLPVVFWSMLIGAASLAGVPLITAGSFSKDRILWEVWSSPIGGPWLWVAGLVGVGLTALYSFRLIFLAFFGERKTVPAPKGGAALGLPLIVLAVLSIGAGWMGWPELAGPVHEEHGSPWQELLMEGIVGAVALVGIALAYLFFMYRPRVVESLVTAEPVQEVRTVLARGPFNLVYDRLVVRPFLWATRSTRTDPFDRAYERLIAQPFVRFAERNQQDLVNRLYDAVVRISEWMHEGLHRLQTG
ncbi:MAG TPA: NADH-quinone oxidoreductase subunit L, partial [Nitrospiraceae bacterium]|nr:NADH-quinone oxidoreductase subunit L [Nitrospiraceae bacterium]